MAQGTSLWHSSPGSTILRSLAGEIVDGQDGHGHGRRSPQKHQHPDASFIDFQCSADSPCKCRAYIVWTRLHFFRAIHDANMMQTIQHHPTSIVVSPRQIFKKCCKCVQLLEDLKAVRDTEASSSIIVALLARRRFFEEVKYGEVERVNWWVPGSMSSHTESKQHSKSRFW